MDPLRTRTATIDSDHPRVVEFARHDAANAKDDREWAVALCYATRDEIRYRLIQLTRQLLQTRHEKRIE